MLVRLIIATLPGDYRTSNVWALQASATEPASHRNRGNLSQNGVRRSTTMQPELEPIGPREALESYLIDRSGDPRTDPVAGGILVEPA